MPRRPPVQGPLSFGRAGDVRDPGEQARPSPPPGEAWGWRLVRGTFALVAAVAGLAAAALGTWLWSRYRPEGAAFDLSVTVGQQVKQVADTRWALDAYATAWVVLGLASVAWLATALVSSPTSRRILATGALVALAGGALVAWTAPQLAWDDVVVGGAVGALEGLHVEGDVDQYVVDGREVDATTHRYLLLGHLLGASLVATGLLAGGSLARAQRRRPSPRTSTSHP